MTIHAYTSFTYSYLDRALVLAETLRQQHPDWTLWAVVVDAPPPGESMDALLAPFDRVLQPQDLMDPGTTDPESWIFGHDIVEVCTAVKGRALARILDEPGVSKVFYFDPDIALFGPMHPVVDLLDTCSIVLTPHQIDPDPRAMRTAIQDNEITSLSHGVFNLGFIAVANVAEGRRFAQWWGDRLWDWCLDDVPMGLFTDQKWCNLVPCFFDGTHVLRDPGYNVASWNLSQRRVAFDHDGNVTVNGRPLRFFHFTKLGALGDTMTRRYASDMPDVFELWSWYRRRVFHHRDGRIPKGWWHFGSFDNGVAIPGDVRRLYRDRRDLRQAFPRPRHLDNGFFHWLAAEGLITAREAAE